MKHALKILSCLWVISIIGVHAKAVERTSIAPNGETAIVASSTKVSVRVQIRTHEVEIGEPSEKRPDVIRSSCTYSRYPCSIVDGIDILVNGKPIIVPRSVFCDLADLNTAEIRIEQKESILTLNGGDASESYIVKIEFDAERVKRRCLSSSMAPGKLLQETIYSLQILKDKQSR
jgi:hypothetical protein